MSQELTPREAEARRVAARALPATLADWCVVDLADRDGLVRCVAVTRSGTDDAGLARAFRSVPGTSVGRLPGAPLLLETVTDVALADAGFAADRAQLLERTRAHSLVCLPLRAGGRTLGLLTLLRGGARAAFAPGDLAAVIELASRAAVAIDGAGGDDGLLGACPAMRRVRQLIERIAATDATALITGASGTGKELVARALHEQGRRRGMPFVAVNCAAISETLLESELFGHTKGAFTDARSARRGLFLQAHGGTLFLDEIADLPLAMQPKLLRALQERTVRPVGGDAEERCDVRLVTASNVDLDAAVAQKRFREDLFYRINVVRIEMPPLSARGDDILLLARHFAARAAAKCDKRVPGLSPAASEKLLEYGWPGNVRELENSMERAVALAVSGELTVEDLPDRVRDARPDAGGEGLLSMQEVERRHILRVLEAVGGSKGRAADVLGLDRSTLYRKLDGYARLPRI